jgi:hypothetical protein
VVILTLGRIAFFEIIYENSVCLGIQRGLILEIITIQGAASLARQAPGPPVFGR